MLQRAPPWWYITAQSTSARAGPTVHLARVCGSSASRRQPGGEQLHRALLWRLDSDARYRAQKHVSVHHNKRLPSGVASNRPPERWHRMRRAHKKSVGFHPILAKKERFLCARQEWAPGDEMAVGGVGHCLIWHVLLSTIPCTTVFSLAAAHVRLSVCRSIWPPPSCAAVLPAGSTRSSAMESQLRWRRCGAAACAAKLGARRSAHVLTSASRQESAPSLTARGGGFDPKNSFDYFAHCYPLLSLSITVNG